MGYRPQSNRASRRGYGTQRHEKAKARSKEHRPVDRHQYEENHVTTTEEMVDKVLRWLRNLGSQTFGSLPYSEHFGRWIMNLNDILSEFEASPTINADDQFKNERSQILSNIELKLKEMRSREASFEESLKSLSDDKILLGRIEEEHVTEAREIERQKDGKIKQLQSAIDSLREELDAISLMKTGLFRRVSKKAREQKKAETTQKLNAAQKDLELAMLNFNTEREKVRDEYEKRKKPVIQRIEEQQKDIKDIEQDASQEDRKAACVALTYSVNALLQRKSLQPNQAT